MDPDVDDVADEVFDGLGDPRIDVAHYDVTVRADPGRKEIAGTAVLDLAPTTSEPLPSFTLDLKGPEITTVTVDGQEAAVAATDDGDEVEIEPADPLAPGREVEVEVRYEGTPRSGTFPDTQIPIGWQADKDGGWFAMSEPDGTASWVPVNDHPSDKATWTITLDTPEGATGVANGRRTSSDEQDGRTRWVWEQDQPMASHLALAAVGDYELIESEGPDGILVVVAVPSDLPERYRSGFEEIRPILEFYIETFGEYPDDDAGALVVDQELGLALETQTRPTFGSDALADGRTWALAHEIAHQWFGNAVTPQRWEDLWLSESFATYSDWLYEDAERFVDIDARAAELVPGQYAVTDPRAAANFSNTIYDGGARALHALRLTVGDDAFFEVLRTWYADNDGGTVTTGDFQAHAEAVTGEDLDGFFDTWLRAPEQPTELPG